MIDVQIGLRGELDAVIVMVAQNNIKITDLKASLMKKSDKRIGSMVKLSVGNADLCDKVKKFKERIEVLSIKNEDLNQQLLKTYTI